MTDIQCEKCLEYFDYDEDGLVCPLCGYIQEEYE